PTITPTLSLHDALPICQPPAPVGFLRVPERQYTSRIIKAGALLADTKALLTHWDDSRSVAENLARARQENLFGKASRSRVEEILDRKSTRLNSSHVKIS